MPELFPPALRPHVRAFGRFVRLADSITDSAFLSLQDKRARLTRSGRCFGWRRRCAVVNRGEGGSGVVAREPEPIRNLAGARAAHLAGISTRRRGVCSRDLAGVAGLLSVRGGADRPLYVGAVGRGRSLVRSFGGRALRRSSHPQTIARHRRSDSAVQPPLYSPAVPRGRLDHARTSPRRDGEGADTRRAGSGPRRGRPIAYPGGATTTPAPSPRLGDAHGDCSLPRPQARGAISATAIPCRSVSGSRRGSARSADGMEPCAEWSVADA